MNERLEKLIKAEGLTSAKFAEILSVQPSSISHLLSGRNNPNFEFISRLLQMFPEVNPRWFINGEGEMYIGAENSTNTQGDNCNNYKSDDTETIENNESITLTDDHNEGNNNELELFTNVTTNVENNVIHTDVNPMKVEQAAVCAQITESPIQPVIQAEIPTPITQAPIQSDFGEQIYVAPSVPAPEPLLISPTVQTEVVPAPQTEAITEEPTKKADEKSCEKPIEKPKDKQIVKVMFFYDDNTFEVFNQ